MEKQNYRNHIRWYPAHHLIFYPVIFACFTLSLISCISDDANRMIWLMLCFLSAITGVLSLMLRQHYSLINQNRTVRLELRFRYYVLTHKRFEDVEARLSSGQIYALRFAPDDEFVELVDRALKENLSGDDIKRAIKNWLPDEMRV